MLIVNEGFDFWAGARDIQLYTPIAIDFVSPILDEHNNPVKPSSAKPAYFIRITPPAIQYKGSVQAIPADPVVVPIGDDYLFRYLLAPNIGLPRTHYKVEYFKRKRRESIHEEKWYVPGILKTASMTVTFEEDDNGVAILPSTVFSVLSLDPHREFQSEYNKINLLDPSATYTGKVIYQPAVTRDMLLNQK